MSWGPLPAYQFLEHDRASHQTHIRREVRPKGIITYEEKVIAETILARYVQSCSFTEETKTLRNGDKIRDKVRNSCLLPLNSYRDELGVLRVAGLVGNANISTAVKHPAILPGEHRYAEMLIRETHQSLLHAGADAPITAIRQKYWITKGPRLR